MFLNKLMMMMMMMMMMIDDDNNASFSRLRHHQLLSIDSCLLCSPTVIHVVLLHADEWAVNSEINSQINIYSLFNGFL